MRKTIYEHAAWSVSNIVDVFIFLGNCCCNVWFSDFQLKFSTKVLSTGSKIRYPENETHGQHNLTHLSDLVFAPFGELEHITFREVDQKHVITRLRKSSDHKFAKSWDGTTLIIPLRYVKTNEVPYLRRSYRDQLWRRWWLPIAKFLGLLLGPPGFVFAIGWIVGWVIRGFPTE